MRWLPLVSTGIIILICALYAPNGATITGCVVIWGYLLLGMSWRQRLGLLVLALGTIAYYGYQADALSQQARRSARQVHVSGTIRPGDAVVDGDRLSATLCCSDGERVRLTWRLPSCADKRAFEQQTAGWAIVVSGELRPITAPRNVGSHDYRHTLWCQGITHTLQIEQCHYRRHEQYGLVAMCQQQMLRCCQRSQRLPEPLASYVQAFILGQTPRQLLADVPALTELNLIHLFGASAAQLFLIKRLLARIGQRCRLLGGCVLALSIVACWWYYLFSGCQVILLRPVLAVSLAGATRLWRRPVSQMVIWQASALGTVLLAPTVLLTIGGQLSFLLSGVLVYSCERSFWQHTRAVTIMMLPVIWYHHYTYHAMGILVNVLLVPVCDLLFVPLLFCLVWPESGGCSLLNTVLTAIHELLAQLTQAPGKIVLGHLNHWQVAVLLGLGVGTLLQNSRWRKRCWLSWWLFVGVTIGCQRLPRAGQLTFVDIGQGDAVLLVEPRQRTTTLIDTGGPAPDGHQLAWQKSTAPPRLGQQVIVRYLHHQSITQLDYFVLTHHDRDHIGYAKDILTSLPVKHLVVPAGMRDDPVFKRDVLPYCRSETVIVPVLAGDCVHGAPFQVLGPSQSIVPDNNGSLVLLLKVGQQHLYAGGDGDQQTEEAICARWPALHADLLKVGHHGSRTATSDRVLSHCQTQIAFISVGQHNHYGHPHADVLARLSRHRVQVLTTAADGMIRYHYSDNAPRGWIEVICRDEEFKTPRTSNR